MAPEPAPAPDLWVPPDARQIDALNGLRVVPPDRPDTPPGLFRLTWLAGFGMDRVTRREHTGRYYKDVRDVARQLHSLAMWPEHMIVTGCWFTECEWSDVTDRAIQEAVDRAGQ